MTADVTRGFSAPVQRQPLTSTLKDDNADNKLSMLVNAQRENPAKKNVGPGHMVDSKKNSEPKCNRESNSQRTLSKRNSVAVSDSGQGTMYASGSDASGKKTACDTTDKMRDMEKNGSVESSHTNALGLFLEDTMGRETTRQALRCLQKLSLKDVDSILEAIECMGSHSPMLPVLFKLVKQTKDESASR